MTCLQVLLLCCNPLLVSSVLWPPMNLQFSSQNFQHILTWDDPNNESFIYYKVEYSKDYRPLVPTRECTNLSIPRCDLTKDFTDIFGNYAAQVQIFTLNDSSDTTFSPSVLSPLSDTWLGPPIVDVILNDNRLQINIRPPVSHLWSENEQRNITMLSNDVYPLLLYTIQLVNSTHTSIWEAEVYKEMYTTVITEVLGSTNYCVSVNASTDLNEHSIASPIKCIFTKAPQVRCDGRTYLIVFIFSVIVVVVGLVLFTNIVHQAGSICRKHILPPNALESFPRLKRFLDDNNELSPLVFIPTEIIMIESTEEQRAGQEKDTNNSSLTANNRITI
ncbi:interferon alpha/beta receptor 2-like isoform 1-T2 [Mantella aurantiaca]